MSVLPRPWAQQPCTSAVVRLCAASAPSRWRHGERWRARAGQLRDDAAQPSRIELFEPLPLPHGELACTGNRGSGSGAARRRARTARPSTPAAQDMDGPAAVAIPQAGSARLQCWNPTAERPGASTSRPAVLTRLGHRAAGAAGRSPTNGPAAEVVERGPARPGEPPGRPGRRRSASRLLYPPARGNHSRSRGLIQRCPALPAEAAGARPPARAGGASSSPGCCHGALSSRDVPSTRPGGRAETASG